MKDKYASKRTAINVYIAQCCGSSGRNVATKKRLMPMTVNANNVHTTLENLKTQRNIFRQIISQHCV